MLAYIILIIIILAGQLLVDGKAINKRTYCAFVCLVFVLLCGLRSIDVGLQDLKTVYLPSFRVINSHSIFELLRMSDTQYKFIGFDLYSKFIGLVSENSQFYIFMMAWPFYVAVTYIIYKYTDKPMFSFVAILSMGYFTYSFTLIRGMLSFAALCVALDAALEDKWIKMIIWTLIASSFHITALLFLIVYFIKKIRWSLGKIFLLFTIFAGIYKVLPIIWKYFVTRFISGILTTYNYYGDVGGVMAMGMLLLYLGITVIFIFKSIVWNRNGRMLVIKKPCLKIKINKRNKKTDVAIYDDTNSNMLLGMSICACAILSMTSVLSEMMRIAMIMGLGMILLIGNENPAQTRSNKIVIFCIESVQLLVLLYYFITSALPNMYAIPYKFF